MTSKIKKLVDVGGKEWIKDEMHRIYFNASVINALVGFTFIGKTTYLNGEKISNNRSWKEKMHDGYNVKFYYDAKTDKFKSEMLNGDTFRAAAKILREEMASVATKKDKKAVMTRAWAIAKEAEAKFGGKASQYLSGALKAAWAE